MSYKHILSTALLLLATFNISSQDYDGILVEDVYIKLEFTACHRGISCPDFEITILGDGTVIFEGQRDVSKLGIYQKKIEKQKIANFITELLSLRYFERTDESEDCGYASVKVIEGGNYEEQGRICVTSSHGPFTDINIKFGDKKRKVQLDHYFSEDYRAIKRKIIEAAEVQQWIENK